MRTDSHLAVGSPTVRVVAILAATLLIAIAVAGAGIAGQRLLAADGVIVVDPSGNGTVETISEAVAMAEDGDEIHVRPGTYLESVLIEGKDIVLKGDGPREEIVIQSPEGGPASPVWVSSYGLALVDCDAVVSGLTLRGSSSTLHAGGGAPKLTEPTIDGAGEMFTGANSSASDSVAFDDATKAEFRDNEVIAGGSLGVHGLAAPVIADNALTGGTNIYVDRPGPGTLLEGNTIVDTPSRAIGIWGPGPLTIRANTIERAGSEGIGVTGRSVLIEGNTISQSNGGVLISSSDVTVTGNVIEDSQSWGISTSGSDAMIGDNTVKNGRSGILILSGSPEIIGNEVDGASLSGIVVGGSSSPVLTDNTVCGSATNLDIADAADPELGQNDICADAVDEPA